MRRSYSVESSVARRRREFEAEVARFEESEREAGRIPGDEPGEGEEDAGVA